MRREDDTRAVDGKADPPVDVDFVVVREHKKGIHVAYTDGSLWSEYYNGTKLKLNLSTAGRGVKAAKHALAEKFVPNPANFEYVKTIDGDRFNLSIENLKWCSKEAFNHHNGKGGLAVTARKAERFPRDYDHILRPNIEIPETITIRSIV